MSPPPRLQLTKEPAPARTRYSYWLMIWPCSPTRDCQYHKKCITLLFRAKYALRFSKAVVEEGFNLSQIYLIFV